MHYVRNIMYYELHAQFSFRVFIILLYAHDRISSRVSLRSSDRLRFIRALSVVIISLPYIAIKLLPLLLLLDYKRFLICYCK